MGGGTGQTFDWNLIPDDLPLPLILAGGLTPDNVASAVEQVRPYAVDVSSGVESEPSVKDHNKIEQFIKEVQRVGTS
jgi:phosphoribosylanthranilate isomerase